MASQDSNDDIGAWLRGELTVGGADAFRKKLAQSPVLRSHVAHLERDGATVSLALDPTRAMTQVDSRTLSGEPADRHLTRGEELGRGGMAVVYAGRQTHLGRDVAVKTVRPTGGPEDRRRLVQEARITGFLEHPGIVPVHDLIEDEHGELQVVLKRIDGVPWSKLLASPDEVRTRFEVSPLEWHVSVVITLCRAIQFAHERGVIHRDLKPANVMIGSFGEVSLLDWGVAGTLRPDPKGLLPCVLDTPFAGTLNAMAPEQLAALGAEQGPGTDTFLLGGCLYEALYGAPPFAGQSLEKRVEGFHRPVPFPERLEAPPELVGIVRKALSLRIPERFGSADALRRALEQFLRHRDARQLTDKALLKAAEARASWERGHPEIAEQAAAEAGFGFRAALDLWPEDAIAREHSARLATDRVRFAVKQGEAQAASWMLKSLPAPPPTLVAEIGKAVEVQVNEQNRLKALEHAADRRFGVRVRRWLLTLFGGAWFVFWSWVAVRTPSQVTPLFVFLSLFITIGVVVTLALRRTLLEHRLNREMMLVQLAMLVASLVLVSVATPLRLPVPTVVSLLMLCWALGMGAIAAIVEVASLVPCTIWLGCSVISALVPSLLPACLIAGAFVHFAGPLVVSFRVRPVRKRD